MLDSRPAPPPPSAAPAGPRPVVNLRPRVQVVPLFDGHQCVIVDDFLLAPDTLVDYAAQQRAHFVDAPGNYYPGPELPLGGTFLAGVQESFMLHARAPLGARRVQGLTGRLSLVTRRPDQLLPAQRMPHRDSYDLGEREGVGAMVLYLFQDVRLGGTSFFRPKRSPAQIAALLQEVRRMELADEAPVLSGPPTYAIDSDAHFEKMRTIEPKFNRAIFYSGELFHSGHISAPELLVDDPRTGRLTVNAFFRLRMAAT